ncbi:hypothetical protein PSV3_00118 [Septimatrevirus PSV32]|uniref:Virion protein n=2 Tax=Septimatrevirus TaxID=1921544 RepID=A0A060RF73_9CAUD|nr:head-tail adaptor Ad1 [Pseudomonas phage vB_PaeS_SCH_Ab26]YP_010598185.1 head-tail adaptor Ad1 [Pseudomonas phage PSV3]WBF76820.1 hypothetical protein PSV3_00118 [Pseudomonas phage PSV3]CDN96774.1 virion protein [Pseudomonas phage vB_PaeS_SCH_Ab26]
MAIAIVVEDGSGVPNANSYVSVADARIYASNRGVVLPADDDELAAMLIRSTDYLEAQACRYQGRRTSSAQALEWPRTGVFLNCDEVPSNVIPKSLIGAQVQLAMAINAGFDLQPNVSPQDYVTREKVGPIETEYADPLSVGIMPTFTAANALLAPLFGECASNKFALRTIRV